MRAVVMNASYEVTVTERPTVEPRPGEVLVKVQATSLRLNIVSRSVHAQVSPSGNSMRALRGIYISYRLRLSETRSASPIPLMSSTLQRFHKNCK